jgi:hypothetical protein
MGMVLLCSSLASAGSIFMKNGYIIQGPIVERSEGSIVMGWTNGKVTIHRRFIDSISFDQNEEKKLAEDEQFKSTDDDTGPYLLEAATDVDVNDSLPADVDQLLQTFVIDSVQNLQAGGENGGVESPAPANGGSPTGESQGTGTAAVIPSPDEVLGERQQSERLGTSIRPPKGWSVVPADLAFVLVGPAAADGFQPCLNVVSAPSGGVSVADYSAFLKEEMGQILGGFEVVNEGPVEIGGQKCFQIVGRGTKDGRAAWVRQALIVTNEDWWLVSAFLPATGADDLHAAVEESFKTLELSGR